MEVGNTRLKDGGAIMSTKYRTLTLFQRTATGYSVRDRSLELGIWGLGGVSILFHSPPMAAAGDLELSRV